MNIFQLRFSLIAIVLIASALHATLFAQKILSQNLDDNITVIEANIQNAIGKKAPELKFINIETKKSELLSDYHGKTVLLKFWSRGCKPCEAEMHDVSRLQENDADRGLVVIFIYGGDVEDAGRFFEARRLDGNTVEGIKVTVNRDSLNPPYQDSVDPMSIIIDRNGIIRDGWLKQATYQKFETVLEPLLNKRPANYTTIIIIVVGIICLILVLRKRKNNIKRDAVKE